MQGQERAVKQVFTANPEILETEIEIHRLLGPQCRMKKKWGTLFVHLFIQYIYSIYIVYLFIYVCVCLERWEGREAGRGRVPECVVTKHMEESSVLMGRENEACSQAIFAELH